MEENYLGVQEEEVGVRLALDFKSPSQRLWSKVSQVLRETKCDPETLYLVNSYPNVTESVRHVQTWSKSGSQVPISHPHFGKFIKDKSI